MSLERARRLGRRFENPVPTTVGDPRTIFKVLPEFFFRRGKRSPRQPLGPFRTDAAVYRTAPTTGLRVTWMGHSTALVEIDGIRILTDPVWEQCASPINWAGPKRFFAPPLALRDLPQLDAVLISHDHYDHLGAATVRTLATLPAAARAQWITPLEVGHLLRRFGVAREQIREMDWMDEVSVGTVRVTALPSRHFSGRGLWNRFETLWASFAIAGPQHNVYYGADSGEWSGFAEIGAHFGPFDLTMLEIGASDPLWADIHMGPEGAVRSFQALGGSGLLMPIHWGLFDLALHDWRQPIEAVWSVTELPLWSPTPGLPSNVVPGKELRSEWWH